MNLDVTLTEVFRQKCANISAKFLLDIEAAIAIKGNKPSFEELMKVLQTLDKEITAEGVRVLEAYKTEHSNIPEELTAQFKKVISETVEVFVKKL